MKKKLIAILTLVSTLFLFKGAMAVESVAQYPIKEGRLIVYYMAWTTAAGGTLTATETSQELNGFIVLAETDPGSTAPTDNYDITLTDEAGADVFGGALANRDTSTTERTMPKVNGNYSGVINRGKLTLNLSGNSVNSATGGLYIFIIPLDDTF